MENVMQLLAQRKEITNELTKKLQHHHIITRTYDSSVHLTKLASSFDHALEKLVWMALLGNYGASTQATHQQLKPSYPNKRKALPTWSDQVKLSPGKGTDDGYQWRKYGQKRIQGANNPRAYYRCSNSVTQNCMAKKYMQRSDDESSVFNIVYKGNHTCVQEKLNKPKHNPIPNPNQEQQNQHQLDSMEVEGLLPSSYETWTIGMEREVPFPDNILLGTSYLTTSNSSPCPETEFLETISTPTQFENLCFQDLESDTAWQFLNKPDP